MLYSIFPIALAKYFYRRPPPVHVHTRLGCTPIFICTHRLGHYLGVNILNLDNFGSFQKNEFLGCVNVGGHRYFCVSYYGLLKVKILNWNNVLGYANNYFWGMPEGLDIF